MTLKKPTLAQVRAYEEKRRASAMRYQKNRKEKLKQKKKESPVEKYENPFIKRSNKNAAADTKFYHQAWESIPESERHCKECGIYLPNYSSHFIAHILARKAHPRIKHDLRNFVLLCSEHHRHLDRGKGRELVIWPYVEKVREELKLEYYGNQY